MERNIFAILLCAAAICGCHEKGTDIPVGPDVEPEEEKTAPDTLCGVFSVADGKTVIFSSGNLCLKDDSYTIETDRQSCEPSEEAVVLFTRSQLEACPDGWRVLTSAEWRYLLEERESAALRFTNTVKTPVKVDGFDCRGLFIYPDGYNGVAVTDTCTWKGLAAHGIAYLPALGMKVYEECKGEGRYGYYWASDADEQEGLCFNVKFSSSVTAPYNACGGGFSYAVRLVSDVK